MRTARVSRRGARIGLTSNNSRPHTSTRSPNETREGTADHMRHHAIRQAMPGDEEALVCLRHDLWPDTSVAAHRAEVDAIVAGRPRSTLPLVVFVAESEDRLIGFVEVGLRSHADGCDPSRPCGFLEGWYVEPSFQKRGIGRALVARAEAWCRSQGCTEMASDTWIDREESQRAHEALGFEVVDRCVNYFKRLT